MAGLPAAAAWRHLAARDGFEVLFIHEQAPGYRFEGHTTAVEDDAIWSVRYALELDTSWLTRSARIVCQSPEETREVLIEGDGGGNWLVDGRPAPHVAGCLDVDLGSSVLTNAFPQHRLELAVGEQADAPAAWVRAPELAVERLAQRYLRLADVGRHRHYAYEAPDLDFSAELVYDEAGLIVDYPGLALRIA